MPDPLNDPLAQELARLAPAPTAVTPASVLFAAGVQSAELKANRWRMATGGMALLFVCSWVGMTLRPEMTSRSNQSTATTIDQSYAVSTPDTKLFRETQERNTPLPKPIPPILAMDKLNDETMELRIRGIRLRQDILAGGLGLIPDSQRYDRPNVPYSGSMELNPTVLGGHYAPKKADKPD